VKIFRKCILDALAGKTRILVTHQINFMKYADRVIAMTDGKVVFDGTYQDFTQDTESFLSFTSQMTEMSTGNELVKKEKKDDLQTIAKEESFKGSVPLSFLWEYLTTPKCGGLSFIVILVIIVRRYSPLQSRPLL
jgi:ABC-type multidrug transport system ATPase subunit